MSHRRSKNGLPPGCTEETDRHGKQRVYYRQSTGKRLRVRLRGVPWSQEFMEEYHRAKDSKPVPESGDVIKAGTWRWLCVHYFAESSGYKQLDKRGQHVRRQILESTYDEPITPESTKYFRDMPLARMDSNAVEVLRDRKIEFPEAGNARVKAIRQVFKFGVRKKYAATNPARDVENFKSSGTGFHTWTVEEVRQYEEHWAIGTKARLYLALLLFTGQRRSDVIRMGRQMVRDEKITFTQFKGRNRKPKRLVLPILPALRAVLDASPCGALTFLENDLGRPFTDAGIGNKMREWCDDAKLYHCASHGVRKAGATISAENGATSNELMAVFGWTTIRQAEVYTRAADQVRLAAGAMHKIEAPAGTEGDQIRPHLDGHVGLTDKLSNKIS